jgi:transglutaminase/protease-like cytokinesis protein 3
MFKKITLIIAMISIFSGCFIQKDQGSVNPDSKKIEKKDKKKLSKLAESIEYELGDDAKEKSAVYGGFYHAAAKYTQSGNAETWQELVAILSASKKNNGLPDDGPLKSIVGKEIGDTMKNSDEKITDKEKEKLSEAMMRLSDACFEVHDKLN